MNRAFALKDRSVGLFLRAADMLLDHPDTLDDNLMLGTVDLKYFPFGSAVIAGDDLDEVSCMNMCFDKLKSRHGREKLEDFRGQ